MTQENPKQAPQEKSYRWLYVVVALLVFVLIVLNSISKLGN